MDRPAAPAATLDSERPGASRALVIEPFALGDVVATGRLPTTRQTRFLGWTLDVLITVVVINLFVEYAPSVIIESFTASILTALVLKLLLDAIVTAKTRVLAWFGARGGVWRLVGYGALWLILFTSKFVVLEITDLVFGDRVHLGGFVQVTVLILVLMAAREAVAFIYYRVLGPRSAASEAAPVPSAEAPGSSRL